MRIMLLAGLALTVLLITLAPSEGQDKKATPVPAQPAVKPIKALLVIGGCCHDYGKQKDIIAKGISARANVEFTIAYEKDTGTKKVNPVYNNPNWAAGFDVIVHDECCADVKDLKMIERILEPHRQGLPGLVLHCAMHSYRTDGWNTKGAKPTPWFEFTGLVTTGHGAQQPIDVTYVDANNPITMGLENWKTKNEELYNNFSGKLLDTAKPLTRGKQGKSETIITWTNIYNGKAKVFGTTLGHNNETINDDRCMTLMTRGLLWATGHLTDDGKPAPGYGPVK
ncbi:MAG TPA: ThuA domain-containing protein [Gemmataceae bacterium]|nr:ThuA domain-containing protein [Gemmataceae bacterium]